MAAHEITIIAFAEHTTLEGRAVPVREYEDYEIRGEECRDHVRLTGTAEELLAQADELDGTYQGHYRSELARTIRTAVYFERPDLMPVPATDGNEDD